MLVVGLTGGIGAGKSTVAQFFAELGAALASGLTIRPTINSTQLKSFDFFFGLRRNFLVGGLVVL